MGAVGGRRGPKPAPKKKLKRSDYEEKEVKQIEATIAAQQPAPGTNPLALSEADLATAGYAAARKFEDLPLSQNTKEGLAQHKFITLTAIQRAAIPHALAGRDILGAAKTGSGKTLAFLIPLVEALFRARWTRLDGLGALVLTPTRELALQIFEELRKLGAKHELSAGLLIGGKNVKEEQASIIRMNILVATPGRLLQHMDETPGFDASALKVLVLDEADRILDMGFAATLDAIIDNLPSEGRQTMLFSATQTKSVKDLARLSLKDPEYLAVHADAEAPTPLKLQQAYAVVEAHQKMDTLWSFIKTHLSAKIIVFMSTCKQVRFVHEAFKKLRPGVPLRALHGGMKQMKRMTVFYEFCQAKSAVLFATDIAGRGLDFPAVDWVIQVDCPEDTAAYIHRVGRTARYQAAGHALALLTAREAEGLVPQLSASKIPVKLIKVNPAKQMPIGPALQALLSKSVELKEWAQRALVAYVRSVFLTPNKAVFDATSLPLAELASSWGLLAPPRMRFLKQVGKKKVVVVDVGGEGALGEGERQGKDGKGAAQQASGKRQAGSREPGSSEGSEGMEEEGADSGSDDEGRRQRQKALQASTSGRADGQPAGVGAKASKQKAGKAGKLQAAADSDDDDFLVVKKKSVFEDDEEEGGKSRGASEDGEEEAGTGPGSEDGEPDGTKQPKKKKLKIKVGRASGQRVVFDESGQALDPLAALAAEGLGEGQGEEEACTRVGADGDGVYVVASKPEDRFKAAADVMRKRDQQDKARLKELKRQMKLEKKARAREREGEGDGAPIVTLGRGSDSEDEDGHMSESDGSESESEDEGAGRKRGRAEVAHMGMGRRSSSDSDDDGVDDSGSEDGSESSDGEDEDAGAPAAKRARGTAGAASAVPEQKKGKGAGKSLDAMSLEEQQALAMQLLRSKR